MTPRYLMIYKLATTLLLTLNPTIFLQEFPFLHYSYNREMAPAPTEEIIQESIDQSYHEMMVHVPLFAHENPRSVLIIGGSNGGTLHEVLKHSAVQTIAIVDPTPPQSDDQRVTAITEEPLRFIKKCNQTFDINLCDTTQELFSSEFYEDCKELLNKRGIFVNHSGITSLQQENLTCITANRAPHFKHTTFYLTSTMQGQVAFGWASDKKYRVAESTLKERLTKIKEPMRYYTPEVHRASFALPNFILTSSDLGR